MRLLLYCASGFFIVTVIGKPWVKSRKYARISNQERILAGQQFEKIPTEMPGSDLNVKPNINSIVTVSISATNPLYLDLPITVTAEGVAITHISSLEAAAPQELAPSIKLFPRSSTPSGTFEALPLLPKITPALSIAGIVLILTGTVYTLIGIKITGIQIFLSTAYLTSLSITVLITYVANPSISLAVQGAYFVAVFIPSLLLGAGALIFRDITECLGCLLGGFCLSMWLLVLKSGGLVTSVAGKVIFIGVFCLAALALYLSRHTRSYGIICSTSLSGATAIILGIDCFSRAGLKEFWLYIWALNADVFPLLTVTYPITRGMKVEIACVVLIFMVGIMSQLKLWKAVQARRQKKAAQVAEAKQRQEQLEEDVGRRLEEGIDRERAEWEYAYGGRPSIYPQKSDPGAVSEESASSWKPSTSITETTHLRTFRDQIELNDFNHREGAVPTDKQTSAQPKGESTITVQALQIIEVPKRNEGRRVDNHQDAQISSGRRSLENPHPKQSKVSIDLQGPKRPMENDHGPSSNPSDSITEAISLPVQKFVTDDEVVDKRSSMATFATSHHPQADLAKIITVASLRRKVSQLSDQPNLRASKAHEELGGSRNEYGNDVAVVVENDVTKGVNQSKDLVVQRTQNTSCESDQTPSRQLPRHPSSNPFWGERDKGLILTEDELATWPFQKHSTPSDTLDSPDIPSVQQPDGELVAQPPETLSRVVLAHRTYEWAKHLNAAETPTADEPLDAASTIGNDQEQFDEAAAPVHIHSLQQTALNAKPEPNFARHSQTIISPQPRSPSSLPGAFSVEYRDSQKHYRILDHHSFQDPLKEESFHTRNSRSYTVNGPFAAVSRKPVSQQVSMLKTRGLRSSSNPIFESPIEEDVEASFSPRYTRSPLPATTLIAKRDTMLRNKYSFKSSTLSESSLVGSSAPLTPDDSASAINYRSHSLDDEDISLSERRSLLQQQRRLTQPNIQPRSFTDPSVRRESMLAAWRTSLQHDFATSQIPSHEIVARRTELLRQKYQDSLVQQQANIAASVKSQLWDQAMKRGDMLNAHREVMRKMQAGANRRLSEDGF